MKNPTNNNLDAAAPLLVEIFRGEDGSGQPIIECVHHGLIAVVNGLGEVIYAHGDIENLVHMRSTAKPFQVLPLFEMGIFKNQKRGRLKDLDPCDLVLMISSHAGQDLHTTRIANLLSLLGLDENALRCGSHSPQDQATWCKLLLQQQPPTALHNNCSGKHVAMLMACLTEGYDINSYEEINHPLQQRIKALVAQLADLAEEDIYWGIDGCSLPSFVIPLNKLALMYARLSLWQFFPKAGEPSWIGPAFNKIWTSVVAHPEYLAGENRFDTILIRAGGQTIFSKAGADGLQALAIRPCDRFPHGLGIAIKVADGDPKQTTRALVVKALLEQLGLWPQEPALLKLVPQFKNFRGLVTGGARCHIDINQKRS